MFAQLTKKIWPLLILASFMVAARVAARANTPALPTPLTPMWQTPAPGEHLSTTTPQGADGPVIAMAPDGSEMMVVYNAWISGASDRAPYYTVYDGHSWSPPAPIPNSAGNDSAQLSLAYSNDHVAHLLWGELTVGLNYMRHENGNWEALDLIAPTTQRLFGTSISATGNQTLDAVWAAIPDGKQNYNVYHARSTDGGDTWSLPAAIAETVPYSQAPKVAHDANGNPHVVWQEGTAGGVEIRYARGLPWSQPLVVSPPTIRDASRPALAIVANTLHLAFAESITADDGTGQWAHYSRCSANCTLPTNWSAPESVTGQPVGVKESDTFIPDIASHNGCTYLFYHGYIEAVSSNEAVWNVNSCDGWSAGSRDQVTGFDMRGVHPRVVMFGDDIHLVYEWVSGDDHQVYWMHGILPEGAGGASGVFLPIVHRPLGV